MKSQPLAHPALIAQERKRRLRQECSLSHEHTASRLPLQGLAASSASPLPGALTGSGVSSRDSTGEDE